jgi:nucleotide-binding universal stress UspA family protein
MSIFPTRILLATDGSQEAVLAARTAVDLVEKTGSELHVIHVHRVLPVPYAYRGRYTQPKPEPPSGEARALLNKQVREIENAGGKVAGTYLREGDPDTEIVAVGEEIGTGLIVMGSRGRGGMRRALMGSVSDAVVRHAHCPVMVVRGEPVVFPTKILLATDGSADAELAASIAADLAKSTGSELHIVAVFPAAGYVHPYYEVRFPEAAEKLRREGREEIQEVLDEQVKRVREAGENIPEAHLRTGEPEKEIVALAEELGVGLIAMGSRGLGGIRRALMGSVSASVVRHAHCPVLVVRHIS